MNYQHIFIIVCLAVLSVFVWKYWSKRQDVVTSTDDTGVGSCPKCPTTDCPPGAGNGYSANDYYAQKANAAGLDPSKLSLCGNVWYYDGKFTCIRGIDPNGACQHATGVCVTDLDVTGLTSATSCGPDGTYGSVECQFNAVKRAVDHGLNAVSCPLLTGS